MDALEDAFCYPNPTHTGEITFKLPARRVVIKIFNIAGEKVFEEILPDGGLWKWECINSDNKKVASGIYIYILTDDKTTKTGKLGIIK
ncbi:MAG: T9SS type A sorting domain-containing protein [bacterium]